MSPAASAMALTDKHKVAKILEEIAGLLEIQGENRFKCLAYVNAARAIEEFQGDLLEAAREGRLKGLKGIGQVLADKLTELITTGRLEYYDRLTAALPPGLLELLAVPNLGPKKIKVLYDRLGVASLGELEYACVENHLVELPGFGKKTQDNILRGIWQLKRHRGQHLYSEAHPVAEELLAALAACPAVQQQAIAGSLRRHKEVVKDIDLLASSEDPAAVMGHFVALSLVEKVEAQGPTKATVALTAGMRADLRVVAPEEFPYALQHLTGSQEHNTALRGRARELGLKLNEYGLFQGERRLPVASEADLYARLGLAYIPPELREDRGELEAAAEGRLPELLQEEALTGAFHNHTTWSDGAASLEEMVRAAQALGWRYIGISDHSQAAAYAGGLQVERLRQQQSRIDELNRQLEGITILKGIEADILPDGSLDYDESVWQSFDFVIASVHSKFKLPEEEMTRRVLRVMENPYATMLGHLTGRLLLARDSYPLDLGAVIAAAARHGVLIELNANPQRLELDWRYWRQAAEAGVMTSINPDAHNTESLRHVRYGVGIARKGWLTAAHVLNTRPLEEVRALLARRRPSGSQPAP